MPQHFKSSVTAAIRRTAALRSEDMTPGFSLSLSSYLMVTDNTTHRKNFGFNWVNRRASLDQQVKQDVLDKSGANRRRLGGFGSWDDPKRSLS
jgi:hypothetical protein